jgi:hypothetical protein
MKKKILLLSFVCCLTACKTDDDKDYATLSGILSHQKSDSLMILSPSKNIKTIRVATDGTFSDTIKLKTGIYNLTDGKQYTVVYLKNGYDLKMRLDATNFEESIYFEGIGARTNSYKRTEYSISQKIYDYVASTFIFIYKLFYMKD